VRKLDRILDSIAWTTMVHYFDFDRQRAAKATPTSCPKCGGHRTEAAGRSANGRGIDVRCNDCDERFSMRVDRRASDADNMTTEVEAIRTVGRALAQLPDDASRVRVLRWAAERFHVETALAPAAAPATSPVKAAVAKGPDLSLSVDGLFDLFPTRKEQDRAQAFDSELLTLEAAPVASAAPIADNDAIESIDAVGPIDALDAIGDDALPAQEAPVEPAPQTGSVLHNFVHDFQRLANDCQTLFSS